MSDNLRFIIIVCNPALNLQVEVSCHEDPPVSLFPRLNKHSSLSHSSYSSITAYHHHCSLVLGLLHFIHIFPESGQGEPGTEHWVQYFRCGLTSTEWREILPLKGALPSHKHNLALVLDGFPKALVNLFLWPAYLLLISSLLSSLPDLLPLANFRSEDWSCFKSCKIVKRLHCAADGWCKTLVTSLQVGYNTLSPLSYSVFHPSGSTST